MLYGLATITNLFTISDPDDFTNYVSQGGAADIAAAGTSSGPIPVPVSAAPAATASAAQPATASTSEWPILLLIAGAAYWWYTTKSKGKEKLAL